MDVLINTDWLLAYLLVATRLSALFMYSPVLGLNQAPMQVRLVFVLVLSLIFAMSLPTALPVIDTLPVLLKAATVEFAVGALIAFGVHAAFGALTFAGQLLDYQIGFNAAALFDRNTQTQQPLLATLMGMLGAVVFLTFDGHHALLRAVAQTLNSFPLGAGAMSLSAAALIRTLGMVFVFGLALASPVAIGVFLLDLGTAFMSKSMPQLNIYFLSLPVKIMWGLFLLTLTLSHAGPVMQRLFSDALAASISR